METADLELQDGDDFTEVHQFSLHEEVFTGTSRAILRLHACYNDILRFEPQPSDYESGTSLSGLFSDV